MEMRNILQTMNDRHLQYPENFNNVKEGKKFRTGYSIDEHICTDH